MQRFPVIDRAVGRNIAAARAATGLSQAALAGRLEVETARVVRCESGEDAVTVADLFALAVVLGKAPAFFIDIPGGEALPDDGAEIRQAMALWRTVHRLTDLRLRRRVVALMEALADAGAASAAPSE